MMIIANIENITTSICAQSSLLSCSSVDSRAFSPFSSPASLSLLQTSIAVAIIIIIIILAVLIVYLLLTGQFRMQFLVAGLLLDGMHKVRVKAVAVGRV